LLVIDPHILRSDRDARSLDGLLRRLRVTDGCQVRVKASSPRLPRFRGPYDYGDREQDERVARLRRDHGARMALEVERPARAMEEHDRTLLWHVRDQHGDQFYRVLLGQGLVAFESFCNKRSEGVVMGIDQADFERDWASWR
jgi:hypothetical protein